MLCYIDLDDFKGICSDRYPLLKAVVKTLNARSDEIKWVGTYFEYTLFAMLSLCPML